MTELERESKRFSGNVGKCWHELDRNRDSSTYGLCKHCKAHNANYNAYTIELIRSELERVNKWEGFKLWIWGHFDTGEDPEWDDKLLEAMSTPLLLLQAANAYMEEK